MRRRDNASNNNNWIENYHSDGHYQEILNLSLSSCSTVDSVVVKRHTFSMNNLLNLFGQFCCYLSQTEKEFNDTAKRIKNSKSLSQNQQSSAIQTLNNMKKQNTKVRAEYLKQLNQELANCQKRKKEQNFIPIQAKIMVYEFHQNQIIRQVIEYFNTQKRNELLILQKYYLENFNEKIKLQNKIEFYPNYPNDFSDIFSSSSNSQKKQEIKSENKAEILNPLSSQVSQFVSIMPLDMTFNLQISEKNINSNQYSTKSGIQGHEFKEKVEPQAISTKSQRIQGRKEQNEFKTNSTTFQKSFFNQKKKKKKD